jgi:hypothetical protein
MRGFEVLMDGLDTINANRVRRDALKRQVERDAIEDELRRKALKLQLEESAGRAADRDEDRALRREALKRQMEQQAWSFSPDNPANQLHSAQAENARAHQRLAEQQAASLATKPQTPLSAQLQGLDEYVQAVSDATAELQTASGPAQQGDPAATARATRAQMKLTALQQFGQTMLQKWKPDKPASMVKIKRMSEDGTTSEELEVPAEQWNDQHPAWGRFNTAAAPAAASGQQFPAPSPQAIEYLRANPALRAQFEQKYGPGSAAQYLR